MRTLLLCCVLGTLLGVLYLDSAAQSITAFSYYDGSHDTGQAATTFSPLLPPSGPHASFAVPRYPELVWPVGIPLGEGTFISNYVDNDRATGPMIDYMGGRDHLYDNHRGTDVAIYNFRLMDKGIPVYAAAAGTVTHTIYHFGDRNIAQPYPDGGNGIGVQHDDGTFGAYWHVRTNSVVVEPGERVEPGQLLAYIGSSGWTPVPHLHFEIAERRGFTEPYRDPWGGTYNGLTSLWENQPAYVGDAPLWVMDIMVFPPSAVGGSFSNVNRSRLLEQIPTPAVFGSDESQLCMVFEVQANPGDSFTMEIVQPDGNVFQRAGDTVSTKIRYSWLGNCWNLSGELPSGTWTAQVVSGGRLVKARPFDVGTHTVYAPRFQPVAGRSIRLEGQRYEETLQVSSLSEPVTYHLVNPPSFVHLTDDTVVIEGSQADQPYRSSYFQVVATDAGGRTDTLWYHLVDPTKPFNPLSDQLAGVVSTETALPNTSFLLEVPHPNPAQDTATIHYTLNTSQFVHLEVFDLLGRRQATLVAKAQSPGRYSPSLRTASWAAGVYTIRLATAAGQQTQRLVIQR